MIASVMQKIEFTIVGISHAETEGGYIVLLESEIVLKKIPIHIGVNEGQAVAMALEVFETPRPLTHQVLLHVIRDMKAKLLEVLIYRLFEGIFFAKLIISIDPEEKNTLEIDARPSDAMVLAIISNCSIYITSEIVELAGITIEKETNFETSKEEDQIEFYGMSVEDLEKELKKAISREEYETASKIRDRINFLNKKK